MILGTRSTPASFAVNTSRSNGVGSFTATCTGAVDKAGNLQAARVGVSYGFDGFTSPPPSNWLIASPPIRSAQSAWIS